MPKRAPTLSPCLEGAGPSDMRDAPPRTERCWTRNPKEPQSKTGRDAEQQAIFDIADLGNLRATGKRRAPLQRKGEAGEPPTAPTFISRHPNPRNSPGASKEDTARTASTPPNRRILDFRPGDGPGVGRGTAATPPRRKDGTQWCRRGRAGQANLGFPLVPSYPP